MSNDVKRMKSKNKIIAELRIRSMQSQSQVIGLKRKPRVLITDNLFEQNQITLSNSLKRGHPNLWRSII